MVKSYLLVRLIVTKSSAQNIILNTYIKKFLFDFETYERKYKDGKQTTRVIETRAASTAVNRKQSSSIR